MPVPPVQVQAVHKAEPVQAPEIHKAVTGPEVPAPEVHKVELALVWLVGPVPLAPVQAQPPQVVALQLGGVVYMAATCPLVGVLKRYTAMVASSLRTSRDR